MGDSNGMWFKGAIGIGVLAAGLGVGFYFGIYLPSRDQARGAAVTECKKAVDDQYTKDWEGSCERLKLGKNCKLPMLIGNAVDDRRRQSVDECYRQ